jgi:hypothetical protein
MAEHTTHAGGAVLGGCVLTSDKFMVVACVCVATCFLLYLSCEGHPLRPIVLSEAMNLDISRSFAALRMTESRFVALRMTKSRFPQ